MSSCGRFADDGEDLSEPAPSGAAAKPVSTRPQGLGSWSRATVTIGAPAAAAAGASVVARECQKCAAAPAAVVVRQNEPLCAACLNAGVVGRVRAATKGRGLLLERDAALLALSGGPASAALLHCLLALQNRNPNRPERGKVSFQLRLAHVDASAAACGGKAAAAAATEAAAAARDAAVRVAAAAGMADALTVIPLERVYEDDVARLWARPCSGGERGQQQDRREEQPLPQHLQQDRREEQRQHQAGREVQAEEQQALRDARYRERLQALLSAVGDATACEDLAAHFRAQLLRRAAAAAGCSKLLQGDTASAVAARVVADAAKGRGFSLPADIQAIDARWPAAAAQPAVTDGEAAGGCLPGDGGRDGKGGGVGGPLVVLLPLREVSAKEAAAVASFAGLLPAHGGGGDGGGGVFAAGGGGRGGSVNALAAGFVEAMQANLPASVFTVLRTASHLQAFDFNAPAAAGPAAAAAAAVLAGARAAGSSKGSGGGGSASAVGGGGGPCSAAAASGTQAAGVGSSAPDLAGGPAAPALCRVCMAPLPRSGPAAAQAPAPRPQEGSGAEPAAAPATSPLAAAAIAMPGRLCYGCDRYMLQSLASRAGLAPDAARARLEELLPPKRW
jgi:hypothetical protein